LGYDVTYKFIPKPGGKGEFEIYYLNNEVKKIIFSNNQKLKADGVIVGVQIGTNNSQDIVDLVKV
jgi:hypothetical protein